MSGRLGPLIAILLAGALGTSPPAPSAESASETTVPPAGAQDPCEGETHHAFDFWIGSWIVRDPDGEEVGRNRIRRVAGGCALLERWTSSEGTTGVSLSFFDPETGAWTQVWVGERGTRLHLVGGRDGPSMTLEGERRLEGKTIRDRITWTPRGDGTVRQDWEITDDGADWESAWAGIYHPVPGRDGPSDGSRR